jgi:hypothetical protein
MILQIQLQLRFLVANEVVTVNFSYKIYRLELRTFSCNITQYK